MDLPSIFSDEYLFIYNPNMKVIHEVERGGGVPKYYKYNSFNFNIYQFFGRNPLPSIPLVFIKDI